MKYLGDPKKLEEWLSDYAELDSLYIEANANKIIPDLICWPGLTALDNFSDDEFNKFEIWIKTSGYKSFLSKEQIEDVVSNMAQQNPNYTNNQLIEAIDYYWKFDAFICIES